MPEAIPTPLKRAVPRPRTPTPPPVIEEEPEEEEQGGEANVTSTSKLSPRRGRPPSLTREKSVNADRTRPSRERESPHRPASPEEIQYEPLEPTARSTSRKGKERAWDTSGEIRVRGKEQELREAREDHARNAHGRDDSERERDKQRIRMLEEEVARLRAEVRAMHCGLRKLMLNPDPPPARYEEQPERCCYDAATSSSTSSAADARSSSDLVRAHGELPRFCACKPQAHRSASRSADQRGGVRRGADAKSGPAHGQRPLGQDGRVLARDEERSVAQS